MTRTISAIVASSLTLCSCTTIVSRATIPARVTSINQEVLQSRTSVVVATDPEPQRVDFLTITRDSLYWVDSATENAHAVSNAAVTSITVGDRLAGLLLGYATGAAVGLVIYAATEPRYDVGVITVGAGTLIGGIAGMIIGVPHTYEFR